MSFNSISMCFNPFQPSAALLYPLKTSENLSGVTVKHWAEMGSF